KPQKKIPIPSSPSKQPPVNPIHRDILQAWCLQLKAFGAKNKLLCAFAYPNQKNFPSTAKEARIRKSLPKKSKADKGETSLQSSEETHPPEGVNAVMVTTSVPEALLASWARTVARERAPEAVESPHEAHGVKWLVVHGRSLPADTDGWVHVQFHAGQAWVPGRVSALFLLPASNFPRPYLEDNMLYPKCIHRYNILIKSL
ncbi:hypothetical protein EGM_06019, partial [Macaca fascicularis]